MSGVSKNSGNTNPSVDHLAELWGALDELCSSLTDEDWTRPTGCPGWSVQDHLSHLNDYESRAVGRPAPDHVPAEGSHVKNELGRGNEIGVDYRRSWPPSRVLEEFRDVTGARLEQLRGLSDEDLEREVMTPAGPGTVADMLTLRVMDTWSHEQDIRRAVGRPGGETGPAVDETVTYWSRFLPFVVGKRAGAPEGATVVFVIGDHRFGVEVVDGRARASATLPDAPTATVTMPAPTFAALVGGRADAPDDVKLAGDTALGRKIVDGLGFLP
jgi:uncharacterized protein (TIGR03083 family)